MEGKKGCLGSFFETAKPYIAMVSLQFGYAGMNIITKVSLNRGMSHYVLVVYRHAFATAVIAPFALESEAEDQLHNFLAALRVRTSWAGDRPELVLRGAEVHFSDILLRDEQHAAGDDLRDGSDVQNGDIGHEEDKMPSKGGGNSSHRRWSHAYDTLQRIGLRALFSSSSPPSPGHPSSFFRPSLLGNTQLSSPSPLSFASWELCSPLLSP
ncbi:nodulin MtN21 /EamA-like transporter family protein [Perilla frutescens var. hirtella]|nr:nodulin MtN21 /EamA-like transporter family protein [Perilla frutescens var. hirtella]